MNRERLETRLADRFGGESGESRAVARSAGDLADSDQYERDAGIALTPDFVVSELDEAPEDLGLAERWNWWIGSLELAYGGYEEFRVRGWTPESG